MKLKDYLDKNGLRYNFFAKKVGVSVKTLQGIFNENHNISLNLAAKIVKETNGKVSFEDLVSKY